MNGTADDRIGTERATGSRHSTDRERGAGLIEYVLLIALIALVSISAVTFFGTSVGGRVSSSGSCVAAADGSDPPAYCK